MPWGVVVRCEVRYGCLKFEIWSVFGSSCTCGSDLMGSGNRFEVS